MSFLVSVTCSKCRHEHTTEWNALRKRIEPGGSGDFTCEGCGKTFPLMITPELIAEIERRSQAELRVLRGLGMLGDDD